MADSVKKYINLIGGGSAVAAPSRKRKMISKSKARKGGDSRSRKKERGAERSSR